MRRPLATVAVALCLSLSSPTAAVAGSADEDARADAVAPAADRALARAVDLLAGAPVRTGRAESPTLVLRDLFTALPTLRGAEREQARSLLARPTQGPNDPNGDGYTVPAKKRCGEKICIHWVSSTADAPPGKRWVLKTLRVMNRTWAREVGDLGYRRPVRDGSRGGNHKFDVYLKDVGSEGFYGYCAPERRQRGWRWRASGYCVLDDDFARAQFGAPPMDSLRVTAAHEFFHAIQFAYDYAEDRWLMEGTATWMEERVADDVNDNRQYLRHGQVRQPAQPLDLFDPSGFDQYGNWVFFEYLSQRYGSGIVRRTWSIAADRKDRPRDPYSTLAVKKALPRGLAFPELFRAYASANTVPGRSYSEGQAWPSAPSARSHTLGASSAAAGGTLRIDHMASRNVTLRPSDGLEERGWRLRVMVDGPARKTAPAALLLVHRRDGGLAREVVALDRDGDGRTTLRFSARSVDRVTLTLANASTRFRCWQQSETYSCQGTPLDEGKRFAYRARLLAP